MIECVFTIDYEIYGNGEGSLRDLVHDPAERLIALFEQWNIRFVAFVEVAELEKIEASGTDPAISQVRQQVLEMHRRGFEIALHLHPQWYNARFQDGSWLLDYDEYNLCTLPQQRIQQIVQQSLGYLRSMVGDSGFKPISFRAGNWLMQPSAVAASVLAEHGLLLDSSVFKGGVQHAHRLDYRPASDNGFYWNFREDVNMNDPGGSLLEIPIYTRMVPFWRMLTGKRVALQRKSYSAVPKAAVRVKPRGLDRIRDHFRMHYPLKFDFCRMNLSELTSMMDEVISEDRKTPDSFKPVVAIGHTKDLADFDTIAAFLSYLKTKGIRISTLKGVYPKCRQ